jgi:hypothetical protein
MDFEKTRPVISSLSDIPCPYNMQWNCSDKQLAIDKEMSDEEVRGFLRLVLLRCHPDKFFSKFRVKEELYDDVKSIMENCIRDTKAALQDLPNPEV